MFFTHIRALQHQRTVIQNSLRTVVHRGGKDFCKQSIAYFDFFKSTKQKPKCCSVKQSQSVVILQWVQTVLCSHKLYFDQLLYHKCHATKWQVKSIPTLHPWKILSSWAVSKIRGTIKACLFKYILSCSLVAFATLSYLSKTLFCGEKDLVNSFKSSLTFHIISSALSKAERGIAFEYTQEHPNASGHPSFSSSEELSVVCLKAVSGFWLYSLRNNFVLCSALTAARFSSRTWSTCLCALWLFVCSCITSYAWLLIS